MAARRQVVLCYFLMGLGATEIATNLRIPLRTIERDLEELKVWILQETDLEKMRSVKRSVLTWEQAQKEMWALYHRPAKPGEADLTRKLGAMGHIIAINRQLDDLLLRPPTKEVLEMRREFERMKAEYEFSKRNGLIR